MTTSHRLPAIDVAKGIAILFVICIHSELLAPSFLHTHFINRAVPMFLVLFGTTSTLWWRTESEDRTPLDWYHARFGRLLFPYWLAVVVWWSGQRLLSAHWVGVDTLVFSLFGYSPWMQTSWFVTVLLQLVIVFPVLRWLGERIGVMSCIALGMIIMASVQVYALPLNAWLHGHIPYPQAARGFYPLWLFLPPYLWLAFAGIALVPRMRTVSATSIFVAMTFVAGVAVIEIAHGPAPSAAIRILMALGDPARTVLLVAAAGAIATSDLPGRALAWCGRNSWEIYLGQMVFYNLGYSAWTRYGGPLEQRFTYALVLAIGGIGFAFLLENIRLRSKRNVLRFDRRAA